MVNHPTLDYKCLLEESLKPLGGFAGRLVRPQPELDNVLDRGREGAEFDRFLDVRGRPGFIRALDVPGLVGRREHNEREVFELGVGPDGSKELEPCHSGHLQVDEDEVGDPGIRRPKIVEAFDPIPSHRRAR